MALTADRFAAADAEFQAAYDICDRIASADPTSMDAQIGVSEALYGRLTLHYFQGRRDDDAFARKLVSIRQLRSAIYPASHEWATDLAEALSLVARRHADDGRLVDAEAEAREALAICDKVHGQNPEMPDYRDNLARKHVELGVILRQRGRWDDAIGECGRALTVLVPLVRQHPLTAMYLCDTALARGVLAEVELDRGNPAAVRQAIATEAFGLAEQLLKLYSPEPAERDALSRVYWCRAKARVRLGKVAESLPDWSNARNVRPRPQLRSNPPGSGRRIGSHRPVRSGCRRGRRTCFGYGCR